LSVPDSRWFKKFWYF